MIAKIFSIALLLGKSCAFLKASDYQAKLSSERTIDRRRIAQLNRNLNIPSKVWVPDHPPDRRFVSKSLVLQVLKTTG